MGDETARPGEQEPAEIPEELRAYLRAEPRETETREKDPQVAAAFAALVAIDKEIAEAPQAIDPTRGVGNAAAYVAPVAVPAQEMKAAGDAKIEIAIPSTDVPRKLPEGIRSQQTQEMRIIARRAGAEAGVAVPAAVASTGAGEGEGEKRRGRAGVLAVVGLGAAVGLAIWAMRSGAPGRVPAEAASALVASTGAPEVSGAVSARVPATSAVPTVERSAAPAASSAVSASSAGAGAPAAPAASGVPKQGGHAAAPALRPSEDPYKDAAAPAPVKSAAPSAAPKASAVPSAAPPKPEQGTDIW